MDTPPKKTGSLEVFKGQSRLITAPLKAIKDLFHGEGRLVTSASIGLGFVGRVIGLGVFSILSVPGLLFVGLGWGLSTVGSILLCRYAKHKDGMSHGRQAIVGLLTGGALAVGLLAPKLIREWKQVDQQKIMQQTTQQIQMVQRHLPNLKGIQFPPPLP